MKARRIGVSLAVPGLLLIAVRPWGLRFSGILLLCAAGAIFISAVLRRWAERSRTGRWCRRLWCVGLAGLLLLLTGIETVVLARGLRPPPEERTVDAAIILGAGVNGRAPSLALQTRLDAAIDWLETQPEDLPVVLSGGQGSGEEITEARCMYDYLTAHGVEGTRLLLEEESANTAENFRYSSRVLERRGIDPARAAVAVVSNDFHLARAELIAKQQDYGPVVGVPARMRWLHLEINYYLREAFAVVKTVLFD